MEKQNLKFYRVQSFSPNKITNETNDIVIVVNFSLYLLVF